MATILVLDDRAINREFLLTLLGYAGHTLLEAATATEALEIMRAAHPQLVIADVLMPDVDGFEFVRLLRAEPGIADTHVMFYTATYIEQETRALASALGVTYLLTKPSEPQILLSTVQSALSTPAAVPMPLSSEMFAQEHQRLLLGKLSQKVDELEALNADLEGRVAARTAELAHANAQLSELNAVKDNLLAITSHDLRSPLGAIYNMAELIQEQADEPEEIRHLAEHILSSTRHLIAMVSNMLDLSKLEAGRVALELIELHASEVARRVIDVLRPNAQAKQIDLRLAAAAGEPPITADWIKLSQILTNLISNAIKFTKPGGQVSVTVAHDLGCISIHVADTGLGIPADELPRLFEQFRQVHTRGTADERGSGLGLAIVRQLLELHGGSIEVASVVGQGSVFSIHLPAR